MRAKEDSLFCEYLMRIRNGEEITDEKGQIELPRNLIIPYIKEIQSLNHLFKETYPNIKIVFSNTTSITSRVILTMKNDFVNKINDMLIH